MKSQFPYIFGWNSYFENQIKNLGTNNSALGRIAAENKTNYIIWSESGDLIGEATGKLQYNAITFSELPKVGDWVLMTIFEEDRKAVIHEVLKRQTKFSRKVAGNQVEEQVIATNLTKLFIVMGLDDNFNISRAQRYYSQAEQNEIETFFVLTKADLSYNPDNVAELQLLFGYDKVLVTSSVTLQGYELLERELVAGETVGFVGSSGVGKSTLINQLIGKNVQKTKAVRELDSKGRHTTTRREMFIMKNGAILIDTPGMREFHLWKDGDDNSDIFQNINEIAKECHFKDCTHIHEKGCAVLEAMKNGTIPQKIYNGYLKLKKEMEYFENKDDIQYQIKKKKEWKKIHKSIKYFKKR